MSSIHDLPYEDIKKFLLVNNKNFENKDDAYNKAIILLKNGKAIGHTISIIEWMIAHNLLINKTDIPNFTINEIDNMSQIEIDQLAKLLTMKGNNRNNIKNILKYLHKLDDNIILLPEINHIILNTLYDIEEKDLSDLIKFINCRDILNLLKTHHNKQMIRELLSDNVKEIIKNINKYNNIYFKPLLIGLLEYDELGLAKKFYDYIKILDSHWEYLSYDIINNVYYEFYDNNIKFEKVFKISSSSDLFIYFITKMKTTNNLEDKFKYLYIRFLRAAIKYQKFDFIKSIIKHFNENPLDNFRWLDCIKDVLKEFEDLIVIAKEMI
jgi:hypothetical protein